jgi:hypothetical protein
MSWHHEAPERAFAGYRATNNRLSQHDFRIDFDADLAFVGHSVD